MRRFLSICLLFMLVHSVKSQQLSPALHAKTGAYMGIHPYGRDESPDTVRVFIRFLTDSSFAFTYNSATIGYNNQRNPKYDNGESSGIGRLVDFKGKKIWAGILDEGIYMWNPLDSQALNTPYILNLQEVLRKRKILPPPPGFEKRKDIVWEGLDSPYWKYNRYDILQFDFSDSNHLGLALIQSIARFDVTPALRKYSNKKIDFVIDSMYNKNPLNHIDIPIRYTATIKEDAALTPLPMADKIPENKSLFKVSKGEKMLFATFPGTYMKYIFLVQYGRNHEITKYGWLPLNKLSSLIHLKVSTTVINN